MIVNADQCSDNKSLLFWNLVMKTNQYDSGLDLGTSKQGDIYKICRRRREKNLKNENVKKRCRVKFSRCWEGSGVRRRGRFWAGLWMGRVALLWTNNQCQGVMTVPVPTCSDAGHGRCRVVSNNDLYWASECSRWWRWWRSWGVRTRRLPKSLVRGRLCSSSRAIAPCQCPNSQVWCSCQLNNLRGCCLYEQ